MFQVVLGPGWPARTHQWTNKAINMMMGIGTPRNAFLVSVGSTNFDNRSFSLNDETNPNVLDHDFAQEQIGIFEEDVQHSKNIMLQAWN